uniref:Uncharacterized protein n=1 Tax=Stomoxys calcitrans TaxID=35570 RepID=A0A1I8NW19_STOCA
MFSLAYLLLPALLTLLGPSVCASDGEARILDVANSLETITANKIDELKKVYTKTVQEIKTLEKLRLSLVKELRKLNTHQLANSLCIDGSTDIIQVQTNSSYSFLEGYEFQLVNGILSDALQEALYCKTPTQLVDAVLNLYDEGNSKSFEVLLKAQIQLFHIANDMPAAKRGKDFYGKFAYNLQKLKQMQNFKDLSANLKQDIDDVVNRLPNNLQYLFFHSHFCLMNDKYQEYMYTAMDAKNLDSVSRYIWAWYQRWSIDETGHIKAKIHENHKAKDFGFLAQLWGIKYDVSFYMKPDSKLVAAWELKSEPENFNWNIHFVDDDRVVLSQGDYVVCSTDDKRDSERRQVRGYKSVRYTAESKECQWLLGKCSR